MKRILYLTTANLATNPRLVKEVRTALSEDFKVTLITFRLGNWSDSKSDELVNELCLSQDSLERIRLNATKSPFMNWLLWGITEKLSVHLTKYYKENPALNAAANTRRSLQLLSAGKKLKSKPDLICGHNLGALYPASVLSEIYRIPFVFDVEDYHPGEHIARDKQNEKARREYLLKRNLPKALAITSASPLIGEYTLKLIQGHSYYHKVILNSFPQQEFVRPKENKQQGELKLVWFSQKIGAGRGLEQIFEALLKLGDSKSPQMVHLSLIGEMDKAFEKEVILPFRKAVKNAGLTIQLVTVPPLQQADLHKKLSEFDVGLALEFDTRDVNRQLCLTNKIITYAQAGLFILATDTKAQKDFLSEHPHLGMISGQSTHDLKLSIEYLIKNPDIKKDSLIRYKLSKEVSWEKEAESLKKIWFRIKKS